MTWDEVCERYPDQWVIFEPVLIFTLGGKRRIELVRLYGAYGDNESAAQVAFNQMRTSENWREYYVMHTGGNSLGLLFQSET